MNYITRTCQFSLNYPVYRLKNLTVWIPLAKKEHTPSNENLFERIEAMKDLFRIIYLALVISAVPVGSILVANSLHADGPTTSLGSRVSAPVVDRHHVVHLTQDGMTAGRVVAIDSVSKSQSPLSNVDVFFVQNGVVAKQTLTDDDGQFVVDGLAPGSYSFVAASAKGFAAYGLLVKPYEAGAEGATIFAPTVSPRFVALRSLVEKYLPVEVADELAAGEIPTSFASDVEVPRGANRVQLQGGELRGSLASLTSGQVVGGAHIALIQQDKVVAETTADAEGKFSISGVAPGAYDFVAAGPSGIAAVGFEAVGDQEPVPASVIANAPSEEAAKQEVVDQVKQQEGVEEVLEVVVTPAGDSAAVADQVQAACDACGGEVIVSDSFSFDGMPIEQCGGAVGCGACAGSYGCGCESDYYGGGGGGGAYGMYGPLANLAQLALAGWIISELVDDNDNNVILPPVSPNN